MDTTINELQVIEDTSELTIWNDKSVFDNAWRTAQALATSDIVPVAYQKKPANCLIALDMANRMSLSPMYVMQNLYIVKGNPGWSGQFAISQLNGSRKFQTDIRFEFEGQQGTNDWGCRAWAIDKNGEKLTGTLVNLKMANGEGWVSKSGSKWQTMPEQMLKYRAATFFIRSYAPELLMGIQLVDEIEDVAPKRKSSVPNPFNMPAIETPKIDEPDLELITENEEISFKDILNNFDEEVGNVK